MLGREEIEGISSIYRRRNDSHKYCKAFSCKKYHHRPIKLNFERCVEYMELEMNKKILCLRMAALWGKPIAAHSRSINICGYLVHRIVVNAVIVPFVCGEIESSINALFYSFKASGKYFYELIVKYATTFYVSMGYLAAHISF